MPLRRSERIRAMRDAVRAAAAGAQGGAIAPPQRRRGPRSRPSRGTPSVAVAQQDIAGQGQRPPLPPSVEDTRNTTAGRLRRELAKIMEKPVDGCQVEVLDDNIYQWMAFILGPTDTPYEGGQFQLVIVFPDQYPLVPPAVRFLTKIYHCNIHREGYICLDILSEKWSPALTVEKILLSIMSLLSDPNPEDPIDVKVAQMYIDNRQKHDRTARNWTTRFAKSS